MKKGQIMSDETKLKISTKRKLQGNFRKGIKHSKETKVKMSKALSGRTYVGRVGHSHTLETKILLSSMKKALFVSKENHPRYLKDRSKIKLSHNKKVDSLYKEWSLNVKKRDSFKCHLFDENCKGKLESHHIFNWVDYPELRYRLDNGITLCYFHHPRKRKDELRLLETFLQKIKK